MDTAKINSVEESSLHPSVTRHTLVGNYSTNNLSFSHDYSHISSYMSALQAIHDMHSIVIHLQLDPHQVQKCKKHLDRENQNPQTRI